MRDAYVCICVHIYAYRCVYVCVQVYVRAYAYVFIHVPRTIVILLYDGLPVS